MKYRRRSFSSSLTASPARRRSAVLLAAVLSLLLSLLIGSAVSAGSPLPQLTATKTDAIIDDNGNNQADPDETIEYTVVITNGGGGGEALNTTFIDSVDENTTYIQNSFSSTPIARNDYGYQSLGNVGINVPVANGVLANDTDPDMGSFEVTAITGCADGTAPFVCTAGTAQGGDITVQANGSFTYMPAAGYEGSDSFIYTITDNDGNTDSAQVYLYVQEVIWFVNTNAGSNGDGRLGTPFNSLPNFVSGAADEAGDIIFLYSSGNTYTGGITLLSSQKLIGHMENLLATRGWYRDRVVKRQPLVELKLAGKRSS